MVNKEEIMKWVFMAIMFTFCVGVGYFFSLKYKRRQNFYSSLIMFAQKLDVEINFSRERLKKLIEDMDEKNKKYLFGLDKNFLAYLSGNLELKQADLFRNITFLKNEEKETIFLFFKSLGRSDVLGQSKEIANFSKRFDDSLTKCSTENKKYGSLCFKLGIVAGLFLIVIML